MLPYELFNHLRAIHYNRNGKDLDWKIEVVDEEQVIRVMFQESKQKTDWILNFVFRIIPVIIGGCPYWFSKGWWISWESARGIILHSILNCMYYYPNYKVQICGYSFGGAIAQICGIEIFEATGKKVDLITFGSPKPLFSLFTKIKAKRCFNKIEQYAHWSDLVTWCIPLFGYYTVKNIRLGKFSFKSLFDVKKYHQIYSDSSVYQ